MMTGQRIVVCYLDFDGVVHSSEVSKSPEQGPHITAAERTLFEWMPFVEELLLPHPHVRIILSTRWVTETSYEKTRSFLPNSLWSRVIGSTYTPHTLRHFGAWPRGRQAETDAKSRRLTHWFAIDDDSSGWSMAGHERLILTQGDSGLNDENVRRLISETIKRLSTE